MKILSDSDANEGKYHTIVPNVEFWKRMIPCQAACPVNTDAGRYVQLIAQGEYQEAYLTARSPNPLASICGRVCAAPCEDHCRRGKTDAPVSIRALKRFVTEKYGVESLVPDTSERPKVPTLSTTPRSWFSRRTAALVTRSTGEAE